MLCLCFRMTTNARRSQNDAEIKQQLDVKGYWEDTVAKPFSFYSSACLSENTLCVATNIAVNAQTFPEIYLCVWYQNKEFF